MAAPASARDCDRQCLIALSDQYINALVAHSPNGLPMDKSVAFVEDVTRMKVGEGLWKTATGGATRFSIHVPDAQNQTVGWLGMMESKGEPTMVAIRLRLKDGRIVEAEHLTTGIRKEMMERVQTPRAGLVTPVPQDRRLPHDELIRIGASYYDALDDNDGTKMPFAPDCERHENGMKTAW
ncbi:MAG TPA: hypothetical protein VNS79_10575 [Sphingobium sp.]|nr:hypothetical protein [Sphingobium sp.]